MKRLAGMVAVLALAACTRGWSSRRPPIHLNPNMDDQPRYDAQAASAFFRDGAAMQPPVPGTIPRGGLVEDELLATGRSVWSGYAAEIPIEVTEAFLDRGRERFAIYCTPCHGARGDGDGMLWKRAGVRTADLTEARIRAMRPGEIFAVVSDGRGLMPGYTYPVPTVDRWAIVAWVRELQARSLAAESR